MAPIKDVLKGPNQLNQKLRSDLSSPESEWGKKARKAARAYGKLTAVLVGTGRPLSEDSVTLQGGQKSGQDATNRTRLEIKNPTPLIAALNVPSAERLNAVKQQLRENGVLGVVANSAAGFLGALAGTTVGLIVNSITGKNYPGTQIGSAIGVKTARLAGDITRLTVQTSIQAGILVYSDIGAKALARVARGLGTARTGVENGDRRVSKAIVAAGDRLTKLTESRKTSERNQRPPKEFPPPRESVPTGASDSASDIYFDAVEHLPTRGELLSSIEKNAKQFSELWFANTPNRNAIFTCLDDLERDVQSLKEIGIEPGKLPSSWNALGKSIQFDYSSRKASPEGKMRGDIHARLQNLLGSVAKPAIQSIPISPGAALRYQRDEISSKVRDLQAIKLTGESLEGIGRAISQGKELSKQLMQVINDGIMWQMGPTMQQFTDAQQKEIYSLLKGFDLENANLRMQIEGSLIHLISHDAGKLAASKAGSEASEFGRRFEDLSQAFHLLKENGSTLHGLPSSLHAQRSSIADNLYAFRARLPAGSPAAERLDALLERVPKRAIQSIPKPRQIETGGKLYVDPQDPHAQCYTAPTCDDFTIRRHPLVSPKDPQDKKRDGSVVYDPNKIIGYKDYLFSDADILEVHTPVNVKNLHDVPVAVNENGHHAIQQQSYRSCSRAVAAMLLADHAYAFNAASLEDPASTYENTDHSIGVILQDANLKLNKSVLNNDSAEGILDQARASLLKNGSAILSTDRDIGRHYIILDSISPDLRSARIRDPFHGWDITVHAKALLVGSDGKVDPVLYMHHVVGIQQPQIT